MEFSINSQIKYAVSKTLWNFENNAPQVHNQLIIFLLTLTYIEKDKKSPAQAQWNDSKQQYLLFQKVGVLNRINYIKNAPQWHSMKEGWIYQHNNYSQ